MPSEKVGIDIYARVKPVKRRYARSHMARVHLDCIFCFLAARRFSFSCPFLPLSHGAYSAWMLLHCDISQCIPGINCCTWALHCAAAHTHHGSPSPCQIFLPLLCCLLLRILIKSWHDSLHTYLPTVLVPHHVATMAFWSTAIWKTARELLSIYQK